MRRIIVISVAVLIVGALAVSARAQDPPWKQGMPPAMKDSPLAPIAQPPAPKAPGEIPFEKIKVPPGFTVSLWAYGINNARAMTWGDKGTLFVSSRVAGNVYAVVDRGASREVKTIAKGLNLPNGVAFKNGAPCNICMPPDTHANISRVNPDGTGFEYYAHGVRNSVGFDWHPVTKELYFTTHGRDWLGEDVPNDRFDHAPRKGLHFGYPYCHQGDIPDPEYGKGRSCGEFAPPLLKTGPHVAGNGVHFYTGSMFPAEYKNRAFLAQRGSWNRTQKIGFRVMMVTLRTGDVPKYEPFAEGWLQGDKIWGRPVYTKQMKDGSLLIADDYAGAIYRVTYQR